MGELLAPSSEPIVLRYDGSFDGFLTVIFAIYAERLQPVAIRPDSSPVTDLLHETRFIETQPELAERVFKRLDAILGKDGLRQLLAGFLNESDEREWVLYQVMQLIFAQPHPDILTNVAHPAVLTLSHWVKDLRLEKHRMKAFVRFELMDNGIFLSRIEPDLNVLPLIARHFRHRFADQHWLIFDVKRGYGIYYDQETLHQVSELDAAVLRNPRAHFNQREMHYQKMWQTYFKHVNIPERRSLERQIRALPRRYWKYLTEKQL